MPAHLVTRDHAVGAAGTGVLPWFPRGFYIVASGPAALAILQFVLYALGDLRVAPSYVALSGVHAATILSHAVASVFLVTFVLRRSVSGPWPRIVVGCSAIFAVYGCASIHRLLSTVRLQDLEADEGALAILAAHALATVLELGYANEIEALGLQVGHGVGLSNHEKPIITRAVSLAMPASIEAGMHFALETFAGDGDDGARIESQVVVTEKGHEVITKWPCDELMVCNPR